MNVRTRIEEKLTRELEPLHLEVHDESGMHASGPGAETHFRVRIVSARFEGKTSVQRHQMIYRLLEPERDGGVHALGIQTLTPVEYDQRPDVRIESPPCLGGDGTTRS